MIVTNPLSPSSWTKRQVDAVSRGWWVLLFTRVLSVVAGGIILAIDWTVSDLAVFVGALLVFRGIFVMFSVPLDGAVRGWSIALGALEALVGVAVWMWPGPTLLVIAFAIGWWVLFSGIVTVAGAISGRGALPYWGLMLALGIVETLFAFWLLARPGLTLVAAILAIGLSCLIYGIVQIVISFEVKHLPDRVAELGRGLESVSHEPADSDEGLPSGPPVVVSRHGRAPLRRPGRSVDSRPCCRRPTAACDAPAPTSAHAEPTPRLGHQELGVDAARPSPRRAHVW